jgi:hypothetical protein
MLRVLPWLLALALCAPALAEDAAASGPGSLLILDFKHGNEPDAEQNARLINDLVAAAAERSSERKVITGSDIANVIELEAEREALGCDDTSASCLAEVAGAMGAEMVLFGNVGKLGDIFIVTLNLFNSDKAQSAGRETVRAKDLGELPDAVDRAVARLLGGAPPAATGEPLNVMLVTGGALAGLGVIGAGTFYALAAGQNNVLATNDADADEKEKALGVGRGFLIASVVSVAVAAGGATLMFLPEGE